MTVMAAALLVMGGQAAAADALARFDLARLPHRPAIGCDGAASASPTDVVVCGGKKAMDLAIDDHRYDERPKRVLGADAHATAVQRALDGGISGPALMFTLKWPF